MTPRVLLATSVITGNSYQGVFEVLKKKLDGKMEQNQNNATNCKPVTFTPDDVLREFNSAFLDMEYCRGWVISKLHGGCKWLTDGPVQHCPKCNEIIPDRQMQSFWRGFRIKCYHCGKYFDHLTGTFLSGCHFNFREIVLLSFLLSLEISDKKIAKILNISAETVRIWKRKFAAIK